jgi:O-antigen ligase
VCMLPLVIHFATGQRPKWTLVASLAALMLFMQVLIKSGSRGAFLGMIGVALYFLFGLHSIKKSTRMLVVIGGVGALVLLGSEQYWNMMRTLLHPEEDYNWSGQAKGGRMEVWKRGLGYMMDDPITGVGASAFPIAEGTLSPLVELQQRGIGVKWTAAHNSFVQVGAELGVLGLLAFVGMIVIGFLWARSAGGRGSTPTATLGQALAGSLVGFVVAGFFVSHGYFSYLYVLLALIAGFVRAMEISPPGSRPDRRPPPAPAGPRRTAARPPGSPYAHAPPRELVPGLTPTVLR